MKEKIEFFFWGFRGVWFRFGRKSAFDWMDKNPTGQVKWSFMIGPLEIRRWKSDEEITKRYQKNTMEQE